jgi:ketosteroid isomerase-like protein
MLLRPTENLENAMDLSAPTDKPEAEDIRAVQRERSAALLTGDMQAAESIHADDFQLITPLGALFSRAQYLGAVEAGIIRYTAMELGSPVDVRVHGDLAPARYRAQIEVEVQGQAYARAAYWFTDAYEKREGRWQILWSQGTGITG